ncbi:MAG: TetR/AcrR family transcriptional regulator [Lachnospiraceae bacterium]
MNDKFFDLKKEKQDRIINAALKIFSLHAYRHASTDEMVQEAGISKGLLFHYFDNKLGLYSFLYAYSIKYVAIELYQTVSIKENNYFELLKQVEYAHYQAMTVYPYMLFFLERADKEVEIEVCEAIEDKKKERATAYSRIYQHASQIDFKENIDPQQALHIIQYTIDGIKSEYAGAGMDDGKEMYMQLALYLDTLQALYLRC